jgi:hypothetical protein
MPGQDFGWEYRSLVLLSPNNDGYVHESTQSSARKAVQLAPPGDPNFPQICVSKGALASTAETAIMRSKSHACNVEMIQLLDELSLQESPIANLGMKLDLCFRNVTI